MINSIFYSYNDDKPFQHCIECNRFLLEPDCEYIVEKAFRRYPDFSATDVIFDYAICLSCAEKIQQEMSTESREKIHEFMLNRLSRDKPASFEKMNYLERLNQCMISGKPKDQCLEYQIVGFFSGTEPNLKMPAHMISGEVLDELSALLSTSTIDSMNGFYERNFSPDPEFFEPKPRLILV